MCSVKMGVLKNFAKSLFSIKLQAFRPVYLLKKYSSAGVFLWTLQNFWEHLFWSTSANDCFCIYEIQTTNNVIYRNLHFQFWDLQNIFLPALQTLASPNLCLLLHFSHILFPTFLAIFPMFRSPLASLNKSNAFSHCHKFALIDNAQNLSSGFI